MSHTRNRKGMTGIETAIILIAFVIAASVFAFAVLNMGLLTTSKAQDAIVSGVGQAQSSLKITSVYAFGGDAACTGVAILVQPSGTGTVDFNYAKISVTYKNDRVAITDVYTADTFDASFDGDLASLNATSTNECDVVVVQGDDDTLLESGEVFAVYLNLAVIDSTNGVLDIYEHFTTELIPSSGAKLTYTGTMPATIIPVMILSGA